MTSRQDPEAWRDLQERYRLACADFHERRISADLFRGILYRLGYRNSEIETEVNLNWPDPIPVGECKIVKLFAGARR